MKERAILHSDANCFYASVEAVLNPSLRGKAVAVCGSPKERHGIVLAKSELAKRAGITTGMLNSKALELCPNLIIVKPHFEYYARFSKLLHEIYYRYTDLVEPYGLDECWLDVTDSLKNPMEIAEEIRQAVKDELGLTVSIGVSYNKVFAKLGSDLKKPDAISEITRENFKSLVWSLPCGDLLYCGRSTREALNSIGVFTIGQLASLREDYMQRKFGKNGLDLWNYANGLDTSPVAHKDEVVLPKSIGHGITCVEDIETVDEANAVIYTLCQDIGQRLRAQGVRARGVSLGIKDADLSYATYRKKLEFATQDEAEIASVALEIFKERHDVRRSVRALSVTATHLEDENEIEQLDMFFDYDGAERRKRLNAALDTIKCEYGDRSIVPAVVLNERKMPKKEQGKVLPGSMKKK